MRAQSPEDAVHPPAISLVFRVEGLAEKAAEVVERGGDPEREWRREPPRATVAETGQGVYEDGDQPEQVVQD